MERRCLREREDVVKASLRHQERVVVKPAKRINSQQKEIHKGIYKIFFEGLYFQENFIIRNIAQENTMLFPIFIM